MKARVKKKWLRALRSGRFLKGRGYLVQTKKEQDFFCCLGVLTNLYVEETGKGTVWDINDSVLAPEVQLWAGFRQAKDTHLKSVWDAQDPRCGKKRLSGWNDGNPGKPKSFHAIADLIEKYL